MIVQQLLNALPHGTLLLDEQLVVLALNPGLEALTGYSLAEARGIEAESILRSSVSAGGRLARDVLDGCGAVCCRGTILNRRREKLPVSFSLGRVADYGSGRPGVLLVLEEVSAAKEKRGEEGVSTLVGHSPQMQEIFERMAILARTDASVLITGETGSGKDRIAEDLHRASARAARAFIKVNCGALPEALLESELFGHKKGAFTGAVKDHPGMFRLADHGTLFLTEIGDLSLPLQVKLLSVLDDRSFFPVGSSEQVRVDVRVIAATHRDLRQEVRDGRFREDLFYRLNVLHLHVPPIRQRQGDVRLLLEYFLRKMSDRISCGTRRFDGEVLAVLLAYSWPGNVRELRNVVEYAVHMCRGPVIGRADLPDYLFLPTGGKTGLAEEARAAPSPLPSSVGKNWPDIEKDRILSALQQAGGRRQEAAEILGWGRTTLWRKIKIYNLD